MQNDLFNNPMVATAKRSMTDDQLSSYKKIGEYMYNTDIYKVESSGPKVQPPKQEDIALYAIQCIKSGADPKDLTDEEIRCLSQIYGDKWYEQFDFSQDEIRKPLVEMVSVEDAIKEIKTQAKKLNLSRQQRRALEKKARKTFKK